MAEEIAQKIETFFKEFPLKTFSKGEMLIQAEKAPAGVFYITEGRVSQYDISPNGTSVVVNVFKPPAFFPMSWAINDTTNYYFFEAATPQVITRVAPRDRVLDFLHHNPDVTFNLLSRLYRGTDGLQRRMAHLMGGDAKSRLLFELLNASYRFGESRPDDSIFVPLKENDIAKHSGLTRETINRNLRHLKESGLIEITHLGFYVKDIRKLEAELGTKL
jgi:CRP-like cAMP-binding protein